jgi:hypothetical protein
MGVIIEARISGGIRAPANTHHLDETERLYE